MRAVIYARYSSELQREASIDDQVRLCQEYILRQGWTYLNAYTDRAVSGASPFRPGYQKLLEGARNGEFDVVVAEALDRLSRDQEDTAALYKHLSFVGVKIVTLAEGEISELHVGLKGAMNALFLKDLAAKIRRGLRGRIEHGRSGGSKAYGYEVIRELDAKGEPLRGGRRINPSEAQAVRRIFREYAAGNSPKAIAKSLNADGVVGPSGKTWSPSTIHGNWRRGTGILNNELYVGRLVWNRQRFVKDPETGKRIGRINPESEWMVKEVPELRIIDDDLWSKAKIRQEHARRTVRTSDGSISLNKAHRRRYLLSGLLKCGICGRNYTIISNDRYGCAGHRDRGTCNNDLTIRREEIEERVLAGLKEKLLAPELVKEFMAEFTAEINRIRRERDLARSEGRRKLGEVNRKIFRVLAAIEDGIYTATTKDRLIELEGRKAELEEELTEPEPAPIRLHPNLAEIYRNKVARLEESLNAEGVRSEAGEAIRALMQEIRLVPDKRTGELRAELYGELATILALSDTSERKRPATEVAGRLSLVAEEGLEPPTRGL